MLPKDKECSDLKFSAGNKENAQPVIDLFAATFSDSEGADEGAAIGELVSNLLKTTPPGDIQLFTASENGKLLGAIIFSRMTYPQDPRTVFILSPVAVSTGCQKKGIGQRLINHGLDALRQSGVDIAITYGDPEYYCRVGFVPISEDTAKAPQKLNQPEGWLGQSLDGKELTPLKGPSTCVAALNDPKFW